MYIYIYTGWGTKTKSSLPFPHWDNCALSTGGDTAGDSEFHCCYWLELSCNEKLVVFHSCSVTSSHLSSCSVRVDRNLTGATTMAINCRCHFLSADQSFYFIPWRHKLSAFGFLQRFISKKCIFLHFSSWKLVTNPARQRVLWAASLWYRKLKYLRIVFFPGSDKIPPYSVCYFIDTLKGSPHCQAKCSNLVYTAGKHRWSFCSTNLLESKNSTAFVSVTIGTL